MTGCRGSNDVIRIWSISKSLLSIPQREIWYLQHHFLLSAVPMERAMSFLKFHKSTWLSMFQIIPILNLAGIRKHAEWLSPALHPYSFHLRYVNLIHNMEKIENSIPRKSGLLLYGRPRFDPWVRKIPWRKAWLPTPVFLLGKSYGQRSLVEYNPWSHQKSDISELTFTFQKTNE